MLKETIARAETAWHEGNDAEAERLLVAARRLAQDEGDRAALAEVEVALSLFCLATDDDDRAASHLRALEEVDDPEVALRAFVAGARLALRRGEPVDEGRGLAIIEASQDRNACAEALVEIASGARRGGDFERAHATLSRAEATADPGSRASALAAMERGELSLCLSELLAAREAFRRALSAVVKLRLRRDEGRTLLRYGEAIAPVLTDEERPAVWFGRAQAVLGSSATYRDRAALRAGFRHHGRRLPDHAIAENIAARVDKLERACASLRGTVASSVDAADRAVGKAGHIAPMVTEELRRAREAVDQLPFAVAPLVGEVERVGNDLIELMGTALVERDRMGQLVRVLAELDGIAEPGQYATEAARVAARVLEADRVVLARVSDRDEPVLLGSHALRGEISEELWKPAVMACVLRMDKRDMDSGAPTLRIEAKPRGPVLVAPVRSTSFSGAVYADKLVRSGQFRESDHHLAFLLAEYLAQGFGRLVARDAEKLALAQLEATLDAIRDGVLAIDRTGVIRSVNAAAVRMMRLAEGGLVGRRMDELPHLSPLWSVLSQRERPDGAVVRLAHGSLVVTARSIGAGEEGGMVATLIEMDRAQRLALRITNARPRYGFHDVVGTSSALAEALRLCRQAATVDANVLITGESGTGKEVLAQSIHTGGSRSSEAFVGINCAALPRELLEAELFGYERGAFTGARSEGAVGKFEQAGDGTLLLDEIGDMPLDMQVKLLRVLQERVVVRLGGSRERPVNARIIATTHRALDEAVERGTFRLDLLFRLRVLHIHLPPLRERREDIAALASHFLKRVAEAQGKKVSRLGPDVARSLLAYPWPGNVRELANVIEREVSLIGPDVVSLDRFEVPIGGPRSEGFGPDTPTLTKLHAVSATAGAATMPSEILPLTEVEKRAFLDAYAVCGSNVAKAAKALGVSKVTFYTKLRQWGMHPAEGPGPETMRRLKIELGDEAPLTPIRIGEKD
jgi:sigma-54 dependent transcriptional regulator, acetoin dehydrogenase operon transcriptional activator AcoR